MKLKAMAPHDAFSNTRNISFIAVKRKIDDVCNPSTSNIIPCIGFTNILR